MALKPKKSLEEIIPNAPPDGIDLLKKLLQFNPDKRLTAEQALSHPFVARFHNPDEEPSMDYDVIPALDDDVQLSVEEYRVKLYEVGTVDTRLYYQHIHEAQFVEVIANEWMQVP